MTQPGWPDESEGIRSVQRMDGRAERGITAWKRMRWVVRWTVFVDALIGCERGFDEEADARSHAALVASNSLVKEVSLAEVVVSERTENIYPPATGSPIVRISDDAL